MQNDYCGYVYKITYLRKQARICLRKHETKFLMHYKVENLLPTGATNYQQKQLSVILDGIGLQMVKKTSL